MILSHPSGPVAVWIDLVEPTAEEIETVRRTTGLRVPTEAQVSEIESTSRLAFESGAFYLSAPLVAHVAESELRATPVGFVLSPKVLLTVRFGALASFDAAHEDASAHPPADAAEALVRIFEILVDRAADAFEHSGAACDDLARGLPRGAGAGQADGEAVGGAAPDR